MVGYYLMYERTRHEWKVLLGVSEVAPSKIMPCSLVDYQTRELH